MRSSKLLLACVIGFLAILCTPRVAAGQMGMIRGRVADSTGAPVSQVQVVLNPGNLSATSGVNGDYVIPQVAGGTYTVRARRLGYYVPIATVTVPEGQTVIYDFVLARTASRSPVW